MVFVEKITEAQVLATRNKCHLRRGDPTSTRIGSKRNNGCQSSRIRSLKLGVRAFPTFLLLEFAENALYELRLWLSLLSFLIFFVVLSSENISSA